MTEKEIIKAYLQAQLIIEQIKVMAYNQYPYNNDFQLKVRIGYKTIDELEKKIKEL